MLCDRNIARTLIGNRKGDERQPHALAIHVRWQAHTNAVIADINGLSGPFRKADRERPLWSDIAFAVTKLEIVDHPIARREIEDFHNAIASSKSRDIARWLETPEVLRWRGDSREQFAPIAEDLNEPLMDQWLVEHEGKPFAYLQTYPARAWPQAHLAHLPATRKVFDVFIGDPMMIGRGHGRAFLRDLPECSLPMVRHWLLRTLG